MPLKTILYILIIFLVGLLGAIASWFGLSNIAYDPVRLASATAFLAGFLFAFALHESLNHERKAIMRAIALIGVIIAISLLFWSLQATISKPTASTGPVLPSDSANRTSIPVSTSELTQIPKTTQFEYL